MLKKASNEDQQRTQQWNQFVFEVGSLRSALNKLVNQASDDQLEEISQIILKHADLTHIPFHSHDLPDKLYLLYFISIENSSNIHVNAIAKRNFTWNGKYYRKDSEVNINSSDENQRLLLAKVGKTHVDIVENFAQSTVNISYNDKSFVLKIDRTMPSDNILEIIGEAALTNLVNCRPKTIMKTFSQNFCISETYDDLQSWSMNYVILDPVLSKTTINKLEKQLRLTLSYPRSIIESKCISQQLCSDAPTSLKQTIAPSEWIITSTTIVNYFSKLRDTYGLFNSHLKVDFDKTIIDNRDEFRKLYHTTDQLVLLLSYKSWQYSNSQERRTKNAQRVMSQEKQLVLQFKGYKHNS